jgi:hypothetical protein
MSGYALSGLFLSAGFNPTDIAKPIERWGRKATGHTLTAGSPFNLKAPGFFIASV